MTDCNLVMLSSNRMAALQQTNALLTAARDQKPSSQIPPGFTGMASAFQPMTDPQGRVEQYRPHNIHQNSDDESDVSVSEWSIWPENRATESAQWRRSATAKRQNLNDISAVKQPCSQQGSDTQIYGTTGEVIDPISKGCNETVVEAVATNEKSDPPKTSAPHSAYLNASTDRAVSLSGPGTASNPGKLVQDTHNVFSKCPETLNNDPSPFPTDQARDENDRALHDLRPTMSESLHAITKRFLDIDVLDQTQDVSRFIAYLLDTIDLLSSRTAFLEANEGKSSYGKSSCESPADVQSLPASASHADKFVGKLLHRVYCTIRNHHHHGTYYEDTPIYRDRQSGVEGKFMGDKIVHDLDSYLELQPNVSFLVVNEHNCTSNAKDAANTDGQNRRQSLGPGREKLQIVAPLLQRALLQVAKYPPIPKGDNLEFLRRQGMNSPYPFLFHHHKRLVELALDETYAGVLSPLLDFLVTKYSTDYEEANSLFERGIVTGHHLSKLFEPNQMVISRPNPNVLEAQILYWCHTPSEGKVTLEGWAWKYDGTELKRKDWKDSVEGVLDEQMRIADLKVHPVDFARAEDIASLQRRGREFWSMRDQSYICYTGWDKARRFHFVSSSWTPREHPSLTMALNAAQNEERVMVDMATFRLMHPATVDPRGPPGMEEVVGAVDNAVWAKLDPWPRTVNKTEDLPEKAFMLLPSTIFGFRLQAKNWSEQILSSCQLNSTASRMKCVN